MLYTPEATFTTSPASYPAHETGNHILFMEDRVLDVEASDVDCLYRIARRSDILTKVVYVTICNADIVPASERTESSLILRNLRNFADWSDQNWHTMKVSKTQAGTHIEYDGVLPHALPASMLIEQVPRYDFFSLEILTWYKHRTSRVRVGGCDAFMKIAPFAYQLGYLKQEVAMYQHLSKSSSRLVPQLLGYIYEETPDRVIGFLCQAIPGRHPSLADHDNCMDALKRIHDKGILHGDINKHNMLITPTNEVIFIDLENSSFTMTGDITDTETAARFEEERRNLKISLSDQSNRGKPLNMYD